jgi:predicted HicB family RNase H-like nuclease
MANKRKFTTADEAVNKFFTPQEQYAGGAEDNGDANVAKDTKHTYVSNDTYITNKSKHYDARGKRSERFGLLLDGRLKEDLTHLALANGSKSVNDFIVTALLEYVEKEDNQTKLKQYRVLLRG